MNNMRKYGKERGNYKEIRRKRMGVKKGEFLFRSSGIETRPNSWAKQVREIEWGHWTLDFMAF